MARKYMVHNPKTRAFFGVYIADNATDALNKTALDLGFASYQVMCKLSPNAHQMEAISLYDYKLEFGFCPACLGDADEYAQCNCDF